jgi:hypothetical protein
LDEDGVKEFIAGNDGADIGGVFNAGRVIVLKR